MEVYALIYTVGYSTGYRELIGIYDDFDKVKQAKGKHMQMHSNAEHHYSVHEIKLNKMENITIAEW